MRDTCLPLRGQHVLVSEETPHFPFNREQEHIREHQN